VEAEGGIQGKTRRKMAMMVPKKAKN